MPGKLPPALRKKQAGVNVGAVTRNAAGVLCSTAPKNLSLDSASAVAAHELFNIGNADAVEVAEDAVLEA